MDPKTPGVLISDESQTIGCNHVPYTTVNFFDVRIDRDQILSESVDAQKAHEKLAYGSRLQDATFNYVQAKKILNFVVTHVINNECNSQKLR